MTMTLRIPPDLDAGLAGLAKRQHRSKHAAILDLIAEGIERAEIAEIAERDALLDELAAMGGGAAGDQGYDDMEIIRAEREAELVERVSGA